MKDKRVTRPDAVKRPEALRDPLRLDLGGGVTLVNAPGHFDGGTMLHWADGAGGKGATGKFATAARCLAENPSAGLPHSSSSWGWKRSASRACLAPSVPSRSDGYVMCCCLRKARAFSLPWPMRWPS